MSETVNQAAFDAENLSDWRFVDATLRSRFRTKNFATGLRLVNLIGDAAEAQDHHPDIDLRYGYVDVCMWSHDSDGVTSRDVQLARSVSEFAASLGIASEEQPKSG